MQGTLLGPFPSQGLAGVVASMTEIGFLALLELALVAILKPKKGLEFG